MSAAANLTYDQAIEQATRLRSQGLTYPQIEQHFRQIGYVSPLTRKPIKAITVRHMITKDVPKAAPQRALEVSSPKQEALETVKKILALDGIGVDTQMMLISTIMEKFYAKQG